MKTKRISAGLLIVVTTANILSCGVAKRNHIAKELPSYINWHEGTPGPITIYAAAFAGVREYHKNSKPAYYMSVGSYQVGISKVWNWEYGRIFLPRWAKINKKFIAIFEKSLLEMRAYYVNQVKKDFQNYSLFQWPSVDSIHVLQNLQELNLESYWERQKKVLLNYQYQINTLLNKPKDTLIKEVNLAAGLNDGQRKEVLGEYYEVMNIFINSRYSPKVRLKVKKMVDNLIKAIN